MQSRRRTTAAVLFLLLFAVVCVCPQTYAFAAQPETQTRTTETVQQKNLRSTTVNLYCVFTSGKKIFSTSGSGVFIGERGVILTNAHVAQYFLLAEHDKTRNGTCRIRTGSPARERYSASVLYFPKTWVQDNTASLTLPEPTGTGKNDFALLYVTGASKGKPPRQFPFISLNTAGQTIEKESVAVGGYPAETLSFDQMRSKLAFVTATSTITNVQDFARSRSADFLTLASSPIGVGGVSGGPVVNIIGQLVGIVTVKSAKKNSNVLRAITLPYISRTIHTETAHSLDTLLTGDFTRTAQETFSNLPSDTLDIISAGLLKKK